MIQATEIYYLIFGTLVFVGAIVGYTKVKDLPCLVMGILEGVVLFTAGVLLMLKQTNTTKIGLILGLLVTAALAGRFIPKVMMNRAAPQVIAMALLSGAGMVLTLIAFGR